VASSTGGIVNGLRSLARNYAELARLSNLPTCVSNVAVGTALGSGSNPVAWGSFAIVAAAIALFYVAGMALNDAFDVSIDRIERAERPIPSGRISLRGATVFAGACLIAGLVLLAFHGVPPFFFGLALTGAIIAYDGLHKRHAWTALLMGLCRALIYVIAAVAVVWPPEWAVILSLAGVLALYTMGVTLVARDENREARGARPSRAALFAFLPFIPAVFLRPNHWLLPVALGACLLARNAQSIRALKADPPRVRDAILGWLSGLCLLDAFLLALLDRPGLAFFSLGCFLLTAWGHRRILGT